MQSVSSFLNFLKSLLLFAKLFEQTYGLLIIHARAEEIVAAFKSSKFFSEEGWETRKRHIQDHETISRCCEKLIFVRMHLRFSAHLNLEWKFTFHAFYKVRLQFLSTLPAPNYEVHNLQQFSLASYCFNSFFSFHDGPFKVLKIQDLDSKCFANGMSFIRLDQYESVEQFWGT